MSQKAKVWHQEVEELLIEIVTMEQKGLLFEIVTMKEIGSEIVV